MRDECLNLIDTKIEARAEDKTLTENLKGWRKDRNITLSNSSVEVEMYLKKIKHH